MIVTDTDKKVLKFIEEFKAANTNTIAELFYSSLRYGQHRLKLLYDNKLLKRDRDHFTAQYYYYLRKSSQLRHNLLLTDFYREMNRLTNIKLFKKELTIENIRPDGLIAYEYKDIKYVGLVEVQISNAPLDVKKYENLFKSNRYKKFFPTLPLIFAITNKKIPNTKLKIIQVNEDMSNIKEAL